MTKTKLMLILMIVVGSFSSVALAAGSVAVMPLSPQRIDAEIASILDELLISDVYERSGHKVISPSDINAILGLDQMKAALGCDDVSCAVEIGGALGVDFMLNGSVSRLGGELIITLSLVDIKQTTVRNRLSLRIPDDESKYAAGISNAVSRLFGLDPAPPTDSTMAVPPEARVQPSAAQHLPDPVTTPSASRTESPRAPRDMPPATTDEPSTTPSPRRLNNAIGLGLRYFGLRYTSELEGYAGFDDGKLGDVLLGGTLEYRRRHGRFFATRLRLSMGRREIEGKDPVVPNPPGPSHVIEFEAHDTYYPEIAGFGVVFGLWEDIVWPLWEGAQRRWGADPLLELYATVGVDIMPPLDAVDTPWLVGLGVGGGLRFYWLSLQVTTVFPVSGSFEFDTRMVNQTSTDDFSPSAALAAMLLLSYSF